MLQSIFFLICFNLFFFFNFHSMLYYLVLREWFVIFVSNASVKIYIRLPAPTVAELFRLFLLIACYLAWNLGLLYFLLWRAFMFHVSFWCRCVRLNISPFCSWSPVLAKPNLEFSCFVGVNVRLASNRVVFIGWV